MTGCIFRRLSSIILVFILLLLNAAVADSMSISIEHGYGSAGNDITKDEAHISFKYNSANYWLDETFGYNRLQGIEEENFLGAGPKYKITDKLDLSLGILWQNNGKENDYLGSGRIKYKFLGVRLVGFYQPYLTNDEYIAKGSIVFNPGDTVEFKQSLKYRSDGDIFDRAFGATYNF